MLWGIETSKPSPSDELPPEYRHLLDLHHQLGTKGQIWEPTVPHSHSNHHTHPDKVTSLWNQEPKQTYLSLSSAMCSDDHSKKVLRHWAMLSVYPTPGQVQPPFTYAYNDIVLYCLPTSAALLGKFRGPDLNSTIFISCCDRLKAKTVSIRSVWY